MLTDRSAPLGTGLRAAAAGVALLASAAGCASNRTVSPPAGAPPGGIAHDAPRAQAFLDTLSRRTFDWFWDTAHPRTGLVPDRWPTESFSSVAAVGFGLTAYPIGVERGWVTREEAAERTLRTLKFLYELPQGPDATGVAGHKGFFYHFLDMETGLRYRDVELSTIDTALLLAGALFGQQYFDRSNPTEAAIRAYADSLYRRVDWTWAQPRPPLVSMGWYPEKGFHTWDWKGYNEAMLLYTLALGSPTHPIDPAAWKAWTDTYQWGTFHGGPPHLGFGPLFGHQYSHLWIDYRGIQDAYTRARGIDYFENSRRAAQTQYRYAQDNPLGCKAYGPLEWGLTASDGPLDTTIVVNGKPIAFHTYWARGADFTELTDDCTLVPTAIGGAVPFAPEIIIPALVHMREKYGEHLFGRYGFLDAYNPTYDFPQSRLQHGTVVPGLGWFDTDYLGIDQGPIVGMIENYRTGLIWEHMRRHPAIRRGLERAGFGGGWLERAE